MRGGTGRIPGADGLKDSGEGSVICVSEVRLGDHHYDQFMVAVDRWSVVEWKCLVGCEGRMSVVKLDLGWIAVRRQRLVVGGWWSAMNADGSRCSLHGPRLREGAGIDVKTLHIKHPL